MIIVMDVGGTSIKCGVMDLNGNLCVPVENFPSEALCDRDTVINNFISIIDAMQGKCDAGCRIDGISMAFPGPFDYDEGIPLMKGIGKYDSIYGLSIPTEFRKIDPVRFGNMRFSFINDVSAFGIGMCSRYCLKGRCAAFAIGTGLGSVFLKDGRVQVEGDGIPENGWVYPLEFEDGILDDYISARGLSAMAEEAYGFPMTGLELHVRAEAGEPEALRIFASFGERFARGLSDVLSSFRPDSVALGGNISKSYRFFGNHFDKLLSDIGCSLVLEKDTSCRILEGAFLGFCGDIKEGGKR